MRELVRQERSFAFETTCSGKSYLRLLEQCRQAGWIVRLLYFWLPSANYSVERVAQRVSQGGHNIPTDVIHRRYSTGVSNMRNLYLPMADDAEIYDNRDRQRVLIARKRNGSVEIFDPLRWAAIEEISR
jgi:predicted ABC-type ATPase